jgi:hypothetical protein
MEMGVAILPWIYMFWKKLTIYSPCLIIIRLAYEKQWEEAEQWAPHPRAKFYIRPGVFP